VAGVVLILHFAILAIYVNPLRKAGDFPPYKVQWYTYPFFQQNWNLFVPPPASNYHLYYECVHDGAIAKGDLFEELVRSHRSNIFKGAGSLLTTLSSSIHYFEHNTTLRGRVNGPVRNDLKFDVLLNAATSYLRWRRICTQGEIKLMLLVEDREKPRVYFN
jgi:hypothetical protein